MKDVSKAEERTKKAADRLAMVKAQEILAKQAVEQRAKKLRDARLINIGVVVEQMMKTDETLLSRVEAAVIASFGERKTVLAAFGLEGAEPDWFAQVRAERAATAATPSAAAAASPASKASPSTASASATSKPSSGSSAPMPSANHVVQAGGAASAAAVRSSAPTTGSAANAP